MHSCDCSGSLAIFFEIMDAPCFDCSRCRGMSFFVDAGDSRKCLVFMFFRSQAIAALARGLKS